MSIRTALLGIILLAQAATVPLAYAGDNGRQCNLIEHGIGGTGAPAETAHGIGGTGAPAETAHGIGGTGAPVETAHGIGGTGAPVETAHGIGGTGAPAKTAQGIGGTGAPAKTAQGIGGTGAPAETAQGIGGTGAPAETAHGIGGTGAPVETAQGIGGTGIDSGDIGGIGGTGMQAGGGSGIGGTGIQVAGVVTGLSGSAMAIDRNRQLFMLSKGSTVCPGDRIETGSQASASIAFPDGASIFLRHASVLQIDQYAWDEQNPAQSRFMLTLIEGGLRSVSGKLGKNHPDAYRLAAPNASITVLGTDYQVISVKPGSEDTEPGTYAAVTSGRIRMSNSLGELVLGAGEAGMIRLNKAPAKLDSWPKCMVCR